MISLARPFRAACAGKANSFLPSTPANFELLPRRSSIRKEKKRKTEKGNTQSSIALSKSPSCKPERGTQKGHASTIDLDIDRQPALPPCPLSEATSHRTLHGCAITETRFSRLSYRRAKSVRRRARLSEGQPRSTTRRTGLMMTLRRKRDGDQRD